jgi:hypothetical protein
MSSYNITIGNIEKSVTNQVSFLLYCSHRKEIFFFKIFSIKIIDFLNRLDSDFGEDQDLHADNLPDIHNRTSEDLPLLALPSTNPMELSDNHQLPPWNTDIIDDPDYTEIIKQAERAIEGEILPVRIAAGSSGSYFVRDLEGVCLNFLKIQNKSSLK